MIAGIILAAGKSERMGSPKALLPFEGSTFLGHLYALLKKSPLEPVRVVLGAHESRIRMQVELQGGDVVLNPDYEKGMLSSVQAALISLEQAKPEAAILFPVDHPNISPALIDRVIEAYRAGEGEIIIPLKDSRRGHPVLFAASLFDELLSAPLEIGARQVVRNHPDRVYELPTTEPGVLQDIDTPRDYRKLRDQIQE